MILLKNQINLYINTIKIFYKDNKEKLKDYNLFKTIIILIKIHNLFNNYNKNNKNNNKNNKNNNKNKNYNKNKNKNYNKNKKNNKLIIKLIL